MSEKTERWSWIEPEALHKDLVLACDGEPFDGNEADVLNALTTERDGLAAEVQLLADEAKEDAKTIRRLTAERDKAVRERDELRAYRVLLGQLRWQDDERTATR